jgi:hypothetical protein
MESMAEGVRGRCVGGIRTIEASFLRRLDRVER